MNTAANLTEADVAAQAKVDALLQTVSQQRQAGSFDAADQAVLKQMVESFADKRGMKRLRIAETLGDIGKPATPVLVAGLLDHDNPVVRRACAKTLTLIADPATIPDLIHAALNDADTVVKGSSMGALARMGEAAAPELLAILANPDTSESTKGHAAWGLAFIGAAAKDKLFEAMQSDSVEVRSAVVSAIAKVIQEAPDAGGHDHLINALQDPAQDVRSEAASALGNLAYTPAVPTLIALLQHPEAETRKAAALALMKIGDPETIAPIQVAMTAESDPALQPIYQLAITQLERQTAEDDWD
ncbi:MAG: HEAT repeat domain-containing protein [Cyanobacteria bacterium P01_A01_bin.105]